MSTDQTCNGSFWTKEEDKIFENGLAIYSGDDDQWMKIAATLPGKSLEEIIHHYELLVADVNDIEAGYVPLPRYKKMQNLSHHKSRSSKADAERRRGVAWTEEEHRAFLRGLEKYGRGDWRSISRQCVLSRTPTQVASHAQKFFGRLKAVDKEKRRTSIHDITRVDTEIAGTSQVSNLENMIGAAGGGRQVANADNVVGAFGGGPQVANTNNVVGALGGGPQVANTDSAVGAFGGGPQVANTDNVVGAFGGGLQVANTNNVVGAFGGGPQVANTDSVVGAFGGGPQVANTDSVVGAFGGGPQVANANNVVGAFGGGLQVGDANNVVGAFGGGLQVGDANNVAGAFGGGPQVANTDNVFGAFGGGPQVANTDNVFGAFGGGPQVANTNSVVGAFGGGPQVANTDNVVGAFGGGLQVANANNVVGAFGGGPQVANANNVVRAFEGGLQVANANNVVGAFGGGSQVANTNYVVGAFGGGPQVANTNYVVEAVNSRVVPTDVGTFDGSMLYRESTVAGREFSGLGGAFVNKMNSLDSDVNDEFFLGLDDIIMEQEGGTCKAGFLVDTDGRSQLPSKQPFTVAGNEIYSHPVTSIGNELGVLVTEHMFQDNGINTIFDAAKSAPSHTMLSNAAYSGKYCHTVANVGAKNAFDSMGAAPEGDLTIHSQKLPFFAPSSDRGVGLCPKSNTSIDDEDIFDLEDLFKDPMI